MEGADGVGCFFGRHRIGQVHADEGDVDVLERAHFGSAFGVAGDVEAHTAVGENVAVAAALVVIELSGGRAAFQVVHGDRFDGPFIPGCCVAVVDDFRFGDGL